MLDLTLSLDERPFGIEFLVLWEQKEGFYMKNEKRDNKKLVKSINSGEVTDVVFLLDRSGSMTGIESDTIGGYNNYVASLQKQNMKVTTVLFDEKYERLLDRVNIQEVPKLTDKEYYVRGCTALMDAIGKTIKYMDEQKSKKVIFIITTDGVENASKEYTKEQIRELIKGHNKWEFIYIGADIDSYSEGQALGISSQNIANYRKDKEGVDTLFKAVGKASEMYCCNCEIANSWKDELN